MEPIALTTDLSALLWTSLATIVFLLAPGVVYAYYVLARWIDDDSYAAVMATVEHRHSRGGGSG